MSLLSLFSVPYFISCIHFLTSFSFLSSFIPLLQSPPPYPSILPLLSFPSLIFVFAPFSVLSHSLPSSRYHIMFFFPVFASSFLPFFLSLPPSVSTSGYPCLPLSHPILLCLHSFPLSFHRFLRPSPFPFYPPTLPHHVLWLSLFLSCRSCSAFLFRSFDFLFVVIFPLGV